MGAPSTAKTIMRLLPHPRAWLAKSCVVVLALLGGASAHAADTGAVCVYADINYGGAHTCVDADTPWIGSSWNDRASSVRLRAGIQHEPEELHGILPSGRGRVARDAEPGPWLP